jgi:hypothetical protein
MVVSQQKKQELLVAFKEYGFVIETSTALCEDVPAA